MVNMSHIVKAEPLALRVKDFCQRIGISPSTFWLLVKSEKIRVIRISGRTLVPFSEVERILTEGVR
jgi:predicted site-specific integrase-resolvase